MSRIFCTLVQPIGNYYLQEENNKTVHEISRVNVRQGNMKLCFFPDADGFSEQNIPSEKNEICLSGAKITYKWIPIYFLSRE